jgi:hypothetical protein
MPRTVEVDPIAELRSLTGSLITVYARRPAPGGFGALLTDLLRPIREKGEEATRDVSLAIRADSERIHSLAARLEFESAPAYVVFASELDGVFVVEPLGHETPDVAMIGPRPYLRPLRAAPRSLRSGVLVADNVTARVFTASEGMLSELGDPLVADIGKPNFGGFAGYDEQGVRARAEEETSKNWKLAGQRLVAVHIERPLDYLAIGAREEIAEDLIRSLHPYLARLPRVDFPAAPGAVTQQSLRAELLGHDLEMRRQRQSALAGRVCDVAWSGGNAVLGLALTLEASNIQAVDTLVVAGEFTRTGSMCQSCSRLARLGEVCDVCGASMYQLEDVVGALMETVIASGGSVHQVDVPSPLDVEGIGALTRFPVPA